MKSLNELIDEFMAFDYRAYNLRLNELEKLRQAFVVRFPILSIADIEIDDYVIGKRYILPSGRESFCYLLERSPLEELGSMRGGTALKFGIYYGQTKNDPTDMYRFKSSFGADHVSAFDGVKRVIVKLLQVASSKNVTGIDNNALSPMFKGKILSTYFPEEFLPVFSEEDIDYFLRKLNLFEYSFYSKKLFEKKQKLLEFKQSHEIFSEWNNQVFMRFLYAKFLNRPYNYDLKTIQMIGAENEKLQLDAINTAIANISDRIIPPPHLGKAELAYFMRSANEKFAALRRADFKCELDPTHLTFTRRSRNPVYINKQYTEPHHLIPIEYHAEYSTNIDISENIVSLCSHCHNKLHYGKDIDTELKQLFKLRESELASIGVTTTFSKVRNYYK